MHTKKYPWLLMYMLATSGQLLQATKLQGGGFSMPVNIGNNMPIAFSAAGEKLTINVINMKGAAPKLCATVISLLHYPVWIPWGYHRHIRAFLTDSSLDCQNACLSCSFHCQHDHLDHPLWNLWACWGDHRHIRAFLTDSSLFDCHNHCPNCFFHCHYGLLHQPLWIQIIKAFLTDSSFFTVRILVLLIDFIVSMAYSTSPCESPEETMDIYIRVFLTDNSLDCQNPCLPHSFGQYGPLHQPLWIPWGEHRHIRHVRILLVLTYFTVSMVRISFQNNFKVIFLPLSHKNWVSF